MSVKERIPVIIDTDPGVDDVLAILLALASPELEILAIILTFGNTDIDSSYVNILKLYQTIDRHLELHPEDKARFPNFDPTAGPTLAFGASGPVEGTRHYAKYFHGRDGLGDISSRHPELDVDPKIRRGIQVTEKSGVQLSLELIQDRPARSITYIALGPLTNLAQLIRANGQAVRDRIGRVVCMGGALDVPGNMSPVAEFNFYADPYAVEEVLVPSDPNQGIPLDRFILLPLDITTVHDLPFPSYKEKIDPHFESTASPSIAAMKTPICHFTSSFFEKTREVMAFYGKDVMELHDIVAVWCAIENPPVEIEDDGGLPKMSDRWKTMLRHFEVEKIGERTRGMLVIDRRDERAAYAPGANRARMQKELEKQQVEHDRFESTTIPAQIAVDVEDLSIIPVKPGIACVVRTPGPRVLVDMLFERVWGYQPKRST